MMHVNVYSCDQIFMLKCFQMMYKFILFRTWKSATQFLDENATSIYLQKSFLLLFDVKITYLQQQKLVAAAGQTGLRTSSCHSFFSAASFVTEN